MDTLSILQELAVEIKTCPKCRLAETRTHAVPGEGSHRASIMFVGEGPGENEDRTGRPFVGQAGKFLDGLLQKAGITRDEVFITNIVKCRPPQNRVPLEDEVEACSDYLMAQIAVIEPKFVVPLGGSSLKTLLGPDMKITQARLQGVSQERHSLYSAVSSGCGFAQRQAGGNPTGRHPDAEGTHQPRAARG
jgi:DNA polymerase